MDTPRGDQGPDLAITGSTGWLGGLVARDLAQRGVAQRLVVRAASRAPELPGAAVVECSYGDRAAAERALTGVRTLFMVSAAEQQDRLTEHRTFVDAAAGPSAPRLLRPAARATSPAGMHRAVRWAGMSEVPGLALERAH